MTYQIIRACCACLFILPVSTAAAQQNKTRAENWHQWRGPTGSGVAPQGNPPVSWSETENVKWKVEIPGAGTATPIIWGDSVFVLTAINTGIKDSSIPDPKDQPKTNFFDIKRPNTQYAFTVVCLDRSSGKELWRDTANQKIPHAGAHNDNDFASASPMTDGQYLYCWFGSAGLFCYSLDGNKIWERDLGEVKIDSSLGEGCSPVLHDGKLIIVRDNAGQSSIEVLVAKTGKTIWKKDREERTAWSTPRVVHHSDRTQVITAASGFVRSYDLTNGELIWQCSGLTGNVTPCPVIEGDNVICMSGYKGHAALSIPLNAIGDISESTDLKWKTNRGTPYVPSPLLYDGLLFFNQSNQGILRCVDSKTGDVVFGPQRLKGVSNIYASPVGAAGRVYFTGRNGTTAVLKRSRQYELLATNRLNDRFDASPAIAGQQLFLRGEKHLYCIAE